MHECVGLAVVAFAGRLLDAERARLANNGLRAQELPTCAVKCVSSGVVLVVDGDVNVATSSVVGGDFDLDGSVVGSVRGRRRLVSSAWLAWIVVEAVASAVTR